MCGRLDFYLDSFSRLPAEKDKAIWPPQTRFFSPNTPLLLLSLLDHIHTGDITRNFITLNAELNETYHRYLDTVLTIKNYNTLIQPMLLLDRTDFWELKPREGRQLHSTLLTMDQFRKYYYGAEIHRELFILLKMATLRGKLREVLLQTYFSEDVHSKLRSQSYINCEASNYKEHLLKSSAGTPYDTEESPTEFCLISDTEILEKQARELGVQKAVLHLYDHHCALCRIKIRIPEEHSVVDAVRIQPLEKSHRDHPTNTMALCKVCHWLFEEGFITVDGDSFVLLSPSITQNNDLPNNIMELGGKPIHRPLQSRYWPHQRNFEWHRRHRFRKD